MKVASESYVNESENPSDFGFAKSCGNPTDNILIQIWTPSHQYIQQRFYEHFSHLCELPKGL